MFTFTDYVLNGQPNGAIANGLASIHYDLGIKRPYFDENGVACITRNTGRYQRDPQTGKRIPIYKKMRVEEARANGYEVPTVNANTLTKDEWIQFDQAVLLATRQRLRAWADLAASSTYTVDGMSSMTLEYQAQSDPGEALIDFDVLAEGRGDTPLFDLRSLPLPIIHADFQYSERQLAVSRNSGRPLDTSMAEASARRIAETIEQLTIGTITGPSYGYQSTGRNAHNSEILSKVYGYTNYPHRITKTDLNTPTGTNPEAVMTDVLEMIELLQADGFFGPYMLYHSTGYSRYLNDDYFRTGSTSAVRSLRERIMEIEGVMDIRRLDYLTSGYQLLLIQMTPDVARAVVGMPLTTVQWDEKGGLLKKFKIMTIMVPQLRSDYNENCGICHGTTS